MCENNGDNNEENQNLDENQDLDENQSLTVNEAFKNYTDILDEIQLLEDRGQGQANAALSQLKDFLKDHRICPPEATIKITNNKLDIRTREVYKTDKIMEIENFTGFELIYKDQNHYIFQYAVKL